MAVKGSALTEEAGAPARAGVGSPWPGRIGLAEVEETSLVVRAEFSDFEDYWRPFLSGDGPPGQYVTGLAAPARERLRTHLRRAYESNRPDGPRSFAAVAWACRGVVP